jgi:transcriptional regulator with XRE-family HTH domain
LRELRDQAGISQEKLAEKANLHRNTVGTIERGQQVPTLDVICKLAHALNMKPYQLIDHIP